MPKFCYDGFFFFSDSTHMHTEMRSREGVLHSSVLVKTSKVH